MVQSVLFRRGHRYQVRTDGPHGRLADSEIADTLAVYSLQQYRIPFPSGPYQADVTRFCRSPGTGIGKPKAASGGFICIRNGG